LACADGAATATALTAENAEGVENVTRPDVAVPLRCAVLGVLGVR
jgi:hypothetical protein